MKITNIIKEELQNILNEKTYKVYHGTNEKFGKFNFNKTTQGIIWFTDSIDSIQKGEHGGQGNKYIMTRYITINNPAGWDEYEKYGLGQLQDMGYDGVILPQDDKTDYFVFSNKNISAKPLTEEEDYRGQHTAPGIDDSPMYDVTNSFGKDMYTNNALRCFGGYGDYDRYSIALIQQAYNKPNMPVKIYRAVPSILTNQEKINNYEKQKAYISKTGKLPREVDNWQNSSEYYDWISDEIERLKSLPPEQDTKVKINSGDWVTINPAYAKQHGISNLNGKFKILTKTVPAKNLYTNGDSIHEWGYVGNDLNEETNRFTNADTNINLNEGDIYFIIKKDLINSASWSEMFWLHMFNSQTNEKMGRMFVEFNHQNKQAKVWRSHVIEEFRGKGYGKRLYLKTKEFANEHGYNLYGDDVQSQDALNVWDSFKKSGLAKTDDDGKLYIEEIDNENITITPKDIKLIGSLRTDGYESIIQAYVYPNQSRTPIKYEFLSSINLDKYSYRVSGTFNQQPKSFNDKDLIKIEIVLDYENVENYVANRKNISTEIKNQFKKQLADKLNQSSQTIDERKKKRQMGMALPIGQIFSTGMGEGVADKYAEKEFNIPNTGKDDYYRATAALPPDPSMGEYIGVVMGDVNGRTEILSRIFKSPKNLSQFDSNTRAVTDKQGNLYVAEKDGNFYHDDLMDAIAKTGAQNSFMQWCRMRTSNIFALSGSYMELYRKQTRELEDEFYNNAKKANPQFKFLAQHHADVANENVDDNNSSKKLYYHGRSKSRPYTGKYIFITDNIGYASGYSDDNKLYAYSIPFDKNKIFTINNPNHLKLLKKYIDDQTINAIINDSGEGEEIDWATLSYISTDLFEEPEDLFQHLGFYGVRLKERQGIESIYVFNEKNLKPEGVIDLTTPEMIKQIGQFYRDFEKDKNFLEEDDANGDNLNNTNTITKSPQEIADSLITDPRFKKGTVLTNVDMQLADEAFKRDEGFYIGKDDKGIGNRKERVLQNIQSGELKYAPEASIYLTIDNKPRLSFGDGRHRFAVLRDLGVKSINISIWNGSKKLIPLLQKKQYRSNSK